MKLFVNVESELHLLNIKRETMMVDTEVIVSEHFRSNVNPMTLKMLHYDSVAAAIPSSLLQRRRLNTNLTLNIASAPTTRSPIAGQKNRTVNKKKGLLQRRGSNPSLSLNIPIGQIAEVTATPINSQRKSFSAEESIEPPVASPRYFQTDLVDRKATNPRLRIITTKPLSPKATSEELRNHLDDIEHLQNASNALSSNDLIALSEYFDRIDEGGNALLSRNVLEKMHQEFWNLPTNFQEKSLVFGSQMKNRYKTILPNEHSRVLLGCEDAIGSNSKFNFDTEPYINANYIKVSRINRNHPKPKHSTHSIRFNFRALRTLTMPISRHKDRCQTQSTISGWWFNRMLISSVSPTTHQSLRFRKSWCSPILSKTTKPNVTNISPWILVKILYFQKTTQVLTFEGSFRSTTRCHKMPCLARCRALSAIFVWEIAGWTLKRVTIFERSKWPTIWQDPMDQPLTRRNSLAAIIGFINGRTTVPRRISMLCWICVWSWWKRKTRCREIRITTHPRSLILILIF